MSINGSETMGDWRVTLLKLFTFLFYMSYSFSLSAGSSPFLSTSPSQLCKKIGAINELGALEDTVNDVSTINPISVTCVFKPRTVEEVSDVVKWIFDWNSLNSDRKISLSIAGTRYSQGGHVANDGGITLDLSRLNRVFTPVQHNGGWEVKVQAGALWHQVHDVIKQYNGMSLANKVQQSSTPFSVGGSLSVNAHGRNFSYGSMIHSVRSIRVVLPNGQIVHADRNRNSDIFRLAIGGYGLFGVITEVTLELIPNHTLAVEHKHFNTIDSYITYILGKLQDVDRGQIIRDTNGQISIEKYSPVSYLFATVALDKKNFLKSINSYIYNQEDPIDNTGKVNLDPAPGLLNLKAWLTKIGFLAKRNGYLVKAAQELQHRFLMKQDTRLKTLTPPIKPILAVTSKNKPDLLQEYFVPVDRVPEFFLSLRKVFENNDIILSNVSLRFIPKSHDRAILSYVSDIEDQFAIVLYFSMNLDDANIAKASQWTQTLVQSAIDLGGRYYLPYQRWPTQEQFESAYPMRSEFVAFKKQIDPYDVFTNRFHKKYLSDY